MAESYTLSQYAARIADAVNHNPRIGAAWVTAETSDLRRNYHCYLELVEKHPDTGEVVARLRANIWHTALGRIDSEFEAATGSRLASGMKVRLWVEASFHPAYGLSLNVTAIDPAYTMGDLIRQRLEILARLKAEGILELNRSLPWHVPVQNIAVISARGAAGFGDFAHQLLTTPSHLRFNVRLFPAVMQGVQAPASIIAALELIAEEEDQWDCVVIIRGGGATSDLAAFENYMLAANIAQFPLPVIIGIGHERDVTALDYVANMRVKTPTAAAEWLIWRGEETLGRLDAIALAITSRASDMLAGSKEQLARIGASLPLLPGVALDNAAKRLDRSLMALTGVARQHISPELQRLSAIEARLAPLTSAIIDRHRARLKSIEELTAVLSPDATLRRGYSITRVNGHAVTDPAAVPEGAVIETTLAGGTLTSRREG